MRDGTADVTMRVQKRANCSLISNWHLLMLEMAARSHCCRRPGQLEEGDGRSSSSGAGRSLGDSSLAALAGLMIPKKLGAEQRVSHSPPSLLPHYTVGSGSLLACCDWVVQRR